jgi:hypothetical protein
MQVIDFQWQLLQLVLEQEAHPEDPEAGVKFPPLLYPQADMRRSMLSCLHCGHTTWSSLQKTIVSNSLLQFKHLNS